MSFLRRLFRRDKRPSEQSSRAGGEQESVDGASQELPPKEQLYCAVPASQYQAGFDQVVVSPWKPDRTFLLSAPEADLVVRCHRFDTLENHAVRLCEQLHLGPDRFQGILHQLETHAENGLLVKKAALIQLARQRAQQAADARSTTTEIEVERRIEAIGMITRDRLPIARRGLESYMANCREHGRTIPCALLDDSPDEAAWTSHRRMLYALGQEYGMPVCYGGPAEKKRFAEALVQAGFPAPVIDFALFGSPLGVKTFGANRNALLLHHAGQRVLSLDDDTFLPLLVVPDTKEGLELSSLTDPTQYWFFEDRESVRAAAKPASAGAIEAHESMLGQSLSACLARLDLDRKLDLGKIGAQMMIALQEGSSTIVTTSLGLAGDSAMATSRVYLRVQKESLERLTRFEEQYHRLVLSREVFRAVSRPTVTDAYLVLSPSLGIDLTQPLPPFFPVLQNEEGIFSLTARMCNPQGLFGFVPYMVAHEPPKSRTVSWKDNLKAARTHLTEGLVRHCLVSYLPPSRQLEPSERMAALGRHLQWLGALDTREFEEFLRLALVQSMGSRVSNLERSLLLAKEKPAWWAADMRRTIDAIIEGIASPDLCLPLDLSEGRSKQEALALLQRLVGNYGQLLVHWLDLLRVSQQLRLDGKPLAEPVADP
ncbi:MAG: hypothetical protein JW797_20125 [Bradymonadales bacterium]|nr:hypothetical protein [Bradymonadales bacterium]